MKSARTNSSQEAWLESNPVLFFKRVPIIQILTLWVDVPGAKQNLLSCIICQYVGLSVMAGQWWQSSMSLSSSSSGFGCLHWTITSGRVLFAKVSASAFRSLWWHLRIEKDATIIAPHSLHCSRHHIQAISHAQSHTCREKLPSISSWSWDRSCHWRCRCRGTRRDSLRPTGQACTRSRRPHSPSQSADDWCWQRAQGSRCAWNSECRPSREHERIIMRERARTWSGTGVRLFTMVYRRRLSTLVSKPHGRYKDSRMRPKVKLPCCRWRILSSPAQMESTSWKTPHSSPLPFGEQTQSSRGVTFPMSWATVGRQATTNRCQGCWFYSIGSAESRACCDLVIQKAVQSASQVEIPKPRRALQPWRRSRPRESEMLFLNRVEQGEGSGSGLDQG